MLLIGAYVGATAVGLTAGSAPASNGPVAPAASDFLPPVAARTWNAIVLHHSATSGGDVTSIDAVHRHKRDPQGKPWLGIGYHFVIGNGHPMGDGEIQPTFRWQKQLPGAHSGKRDYNDYGIGICMIGNFDESAPTARQVAAARGLVKTLAERHAIPRERIVRHQDVQSTACPGRLFPWEQIVLGASRSGGS